MLLKLNGYFSFEEKQFSGRHFEIDVYSLKLEVGLLKDRVFWVSAVYII